MEVLLVAMPFGAIDSPMVGVSTLKAALRQRGIPCDIAYLNLRFAHTVGTSYYRTVTDSTSETFAGEWIFASEIFPASPQWRHSYVNDILRRFAQLPPAIVRTVVALAAQVQPFLDDCMRTIPWERYGVVGFTSIFEQNLASLALARRIKERFPEKVLVIGGANCAGTMGLQLHQSFPFLDYVFTGEADSSFPELVQRLGSGRKDVADIAGVVRREEGRSVDSGPATLTEHLDTLPFPDFDDFFTELDRVRMPRSGVRALLMETSRGCWWGQKHQCRFCGLNPHEIRFRSKSPQRALEEILSLSTRYGITHVMPVDNIVGLDFFDTLLPELQRRRLGVRLFYETKANLKKKQIETLHSAGVWMIQPGIESFSPNVLRIMGKGVTPLQNVQLLKSCEELGLHCSWNLLYGVPGENALDYRNTLAVVQAIQHLQPPMGFSWMRLYRFSPLFADPGKYGLLNIRPSRTYRYVYDLEPSAVRELAYVFDFDFDGKEKTDCWNGPVAGEMARWQASPGRFRLETVSRTADAMVVVDTRPHRVYSQYQFRNPEKAIIDFCSEVRSKSTIQAFTRRCWNGSALAPPWLNGFLDYLIRHKLMLREGDRFLSLILSRSAKNRMTSTQFTS